MLQLYSLVPASWALTITRGKEAGICITAPGAVNIATPNTFAASFRAESAAELFAAIGTLVTVAHTHPPFG